MISCCLFFSVSFLFFFSFRNIHEDDDFDEDDDDDGRWEANLRSNPVLLLLAYISLYKIISYGTKLGLMHSNDMHDYG